MRNRLEAEKEVARLGLTSMALDYEEAVEIATRGWPAWRIAQYYNLSPELIYELGGPAPQNNRK